MRTPIRVGAPLPTLSGITWGLADDPADWPLCRMRGRGAAQGQLTIKLAG